MRPSKRSKNTRGDQIRDETLHEGYLVDEHGKIVGEARRYDPYSRFGEMMLYEIDSFGFCPGYITNNWSLMSEKDLKADKLLRKELEKTKYEVWKRHNIIELLQEYEKMARLEKCFESFCKKIYDDLTKSTKIK